MINDVHGFFGAHVIVKGSFFHLCKSSWKKVQELGLAQRYMEDPEIQLFCGMLDGLAFLPEDRVRDGMDIIKENVPEPLICFVLFWYFSHHGQSLEEGGL